MSSPFEFRGGKPFRIKDWTGEFQSSIRELEKRITALEEQIAGGKREAETAAADVGLAGEAAFKGPGAMSYLFHTRRAFYGYGMMLEDMGLSKDQKQLMNQLRNMMNMVIRLQQTIQMADVAMKAFYAGAGPIGWSMLALSAGTYMGSLVYGARGLGGG